jgi:hypothetical protein
VLATFHPRLTGFHLTRASDYDALEKQIERAELFER